MILNSSLFFPEEQGRCGRGGGEQPGREDVRPARDALQDPRGVGAADQQAEEGVGGRHEDHRAAAGAAQAAERLREDEAGDPVSQSENWMDADLFP